MPAAGSVANNGALGVCTSSGPGIVLSERRGGTHMNGEEFKLAAGIHVVHVLVGFGFLGAVIHQLRRPAPPSMEVVETGGIYWHMVDFLWVIIFALLYVMR